MDALVPPEQGLEMWNELYALVSCVIVRFHRFLRSLDPRLVFGLKTINLLVVEARTNRYRS